MKFCTFNKIIHTKKTSMSSLEKQLKFLKSTFPQATAPKIREGKGRESFLFSAQKAGTLSIDDIHVIGINGAQQLCEYDSRFTPLIDILFSANSKKGNRELETKHANEELDAHLSKFLLLLGPYFQLKPAHMALEYLIRRYK
jgi:U3 small nucleolar RNA-associated protein 10